MPRLNERTHRLLCRAGFVVCCALPTLAVCVWIVAARLPSQRAAWEADLAARLDAEVTIESVTYPQPGVTRLEGLSISRTRAEHPLIQVKRLELRHDLGTWYADTPEVTLRDDRRGLGPLLERCATSRNGHSTAGIQLLVERVSLHGQQEDNSLRQLVLRCGRETDAHLSLSVMVGEDAATPLRLEIKPQADGRLHSHVETGASALPAAVVAVILPEAAKLGPEATISGTLDCTHSEAGMTGQFTGHFDKVDLNSLTATHLPLELAVSGIAHISLADVRFQDGRLTQARGSFQSNSGKIGRQLIETVAYELKLTGNAPTGDGQNKSVDYEQLAFDFSLDPRTLKINGQCHAQLVGAMLISRENGLVLLSTSTAQPQSPTSLARLFSPLTRDWIPATAQAQWIQKHLPVYK
ncbi:MAG: hypothetical protein K8T91_12615 [Planctomycetes bacterium]|nr:hypothetical protein [Planctomycetota bacterium]